MGLRHDHSEEPDAEKLALWTREMVATIIFGKYAIKLSPASVGRLLAQMGISCQKPLHRAIERALIQKWLKKEYPKISVPQKHGKEFTMS